MSKAKLSITLDVDLVERIDAMAAAAKRNRSEQIEQMCMGWERHATVEQGGVVFRMTGPAGLVRQAFLSLDVSDPTVGVELTIRPARIDDLEPGHARLEGIGVFQGYTAS